MKRRRGLRTRLLIAMAAIAVGVLVVTGVTTAALARESARRTAIEHLEDRAPAVRVQLRQLSGALRSRVDAGQQSPVVERLIVSVLRVAEGSLLTIAPDGTVTEGISALMDVPTAPRAGTPPSRPAARRTEQRRRRIARSLTEPTSRLPGGLGVDDLDVAALRAGERVTGSVGRRVFLAEPVATTAAGTAVMVLTEDPNANAVNRARGFFLIGATLALAVAGLVSFFLARRLTRPLAAMGTTAHAIASGDLTARVSVPRGPDDELADLARTLNGMAQQLESARAGERQFLMSVSHDLRTPLTSIRGYAEALTDGTISATDGQRRAAVVIAAEATRLERLVADLLDLARIDARQFSLAPRVIDAAAVVRAAGEAFAPAAADLGIELIVAVPDAVSMSADPDRLAQIVANLVENALKYAQSAITVALDVDGATARLRVGDDGPGVDPAEVSRVFDRLFVSRAVPGRSVGTGLGLAIVGELAGAMGGTASVEAGANGGAAFVVRIPLVADPGSGFADR